VAAWRRQAKQRLGRVLRKSGNSRAVLYEIVCADTKEEHRSRRRRASDAYQGVRHRRQRGYVQFPRILRPDAPADYRAETRLIPFFDSVRPRRALPQAGKPGLAAVRGHPLRAPSGVPRTAGSPAHSVVGSSKFIELRILSLRYVQLGKGGSHVGYIVKPFDGTLRVTKPVRKSLANSRKRVLRGVGATRPAKRRQPVPKPCDRASKVRMREPSWWTDRGPRRRIAWPDVSVLPGSKSRARAQSGFPRNVGDPAISTDEFPAGGTG